jgi:mRNA-degrading endonuclease toxin of MazEF toxin-antitoxin module
MDPAQIPPSLSKPRQGEIWFVKLPTDPPDKLLRPVVIVSLDARNQNDRALTVLVVPLSTSLKDPLPKMHMRLGVGETGLQEESELQAGGITTIDKRYLRPPRQKLRQLGRRRIREIAKCVVLAMGILPSEIGEQ